MFIHRYAVGPLWRKCNWNNKTLKIVATACCIGKNTIAKFGSVIALALGMTAERAKTYTGHWLRRTSLTWAANAGQTSHQMMALSGHNSVTVVQRYLQDNDAMRLSNAAAIAIGGPAPGPPPAPATVLGRRPRAAAADDDDEPPRLVDEEGDYVSYVRKPTVVYNFNFTGATISAPVQVANSLASLTSQPIDKPIAATAGHAHDTPPGAVLFALTPRKGCDDDGEGEGSPVGLQFQ